MRQLPVLGVIMLLCGVSIAPGQTATSAVDDALVSLTDEFGGCEDYDAVDTTIRFFPSVRFVRAVCTREHGDPHSGIVGIDSDGVLYLFDSPIAFGFLVRRHQPTGLNRSSLGEYVKVALELSHQASYQHALVLDWPSAPEHCEHELPADAFWVGAMEDAGWEVVAHTLYPAYEGTEIYRHKLVVWNTGRINLLGSERVCSASSPSNKR